MFITAHQDDWQLFMGSRAYDNVQHQAKVVFIIITAGQANEPGDAWWQAREVGCLNSVRTACGQQQNTNLPPACITTVNVRGHQLAASYFRNTVVYFLRLPDGGTNGQGFARCNFQTLRKFRAGQCSTLSSIDGATTYSSWNDLTSTIRAIVQQEIRANSPLWVHSPNPDVQRNPYDHPDHVTTGSITDEATRNLECRRVLYMGYHSSHKPANLNPVQTANQTALFAAYCRGLTESGQPSAWQPDHLCWLGRQYSYLRHEAQQQVTAANAAQMRIDSLANATKQLTLATPAPNPFDMSSMLAYELPKAGAVTLRLYDMRGQLIQTLVQAEQRPGHYEVWLDVNQFPASGTYICRLQVGQEHREQRVQIVR
ncbi:PIG-L family deacetylase [Hymenobacter sp. CRA2]|uniref:PIG-L family deacetylase n=1 Tax=Hymenobacter sp. CRA2 TaxID=1955620 RepID=UPI0015929905|nr:PIG-L family deacetylase [Hymenobacter sp. CRA2]